MNTKEITKEQKEDVNGEVDNAEQRSTTVEKPACCGCCNGKANKQ